jgi:hypothetical protein
MRSIWPALAGLLIISACSNDQAPTEPTGPSAPRITSSSTTLCPTPAKLVVQIVTLVKPGQGRLATALLKFDAMILAIVKHDQVKAQTRMFDLLGFLLREYNAGNLIAGGTQTKLTTLINGLFCVVGFSAPTMPPSALGPDGAIGVVAPSPDTTTIVNSVATAGVQVPPQAAPSPTLITVIRLADDANPLNTHLDQYPAFYEIHASPPVTFLQPVTIGVCQVPNFTAPDFGRLKVGHNGATGFEILPLAPASFLSPQACEALVTIGAANRSGGLLGMALRGWSRFADHVLLPQYAQATVVGTCCLGGTTKNFSPFGAVDTLVFATRVSPARISGLISTPVPATLRPTVQVKSPVGNPVQGLTVMFHRPAGNYEGALTDAVQVTDANGIATLGGWILGAGLVPDSVVATVMVPAGAGVSGNDILFVALTSTDTPVPYGATDLRYLLIGNGAAPSGFDSASFAGEGSWLFGIAPFGSVGSCSLASTRVTNWPISPDFHAAGDPGANSDILIRRWVTLPAGWSDDLVIGVAIDNDLQVFVNDSDITPFATPSHFVAGFQAHDGCASRGSFVFTASIGILHAGGENLIVIRGRDRGSESFLDFEVKRAP